MADNHSKTYRGHTAIKHAILRDYLGAWVPILGSYEKLGDALDWPDLWGDRDVQKAPVKTGME